MIDFLFYSSIFGGFLTLVLIPLLCLMDLKTRRVPDYVWHIYILANLFPIFTLYLYGLPLSVAAASLVLCCIFLLARKFKAYGGADTKFLCLIAIFVAFNPLNLLEDMLAFKISFVLILGVVSLLTAMLFTKNRKDVPMMIPISIAFITTCIIGVFL